MRIRCWFNASRCLSDRLCCVANAVLGYRRGGDAVPARAIGLARTDWRGRAGGSGDGRGQTGSPQLCLTGGGSGYITRHGGW